MPFVSSSRADNNHHNLLLWFSASNLNQQINEDLWSRSNNYMTANKIAVTRRDDVNMVLETGPVAVTFDAENAR